MYITGFDNEVDTNGSNKLSILLNQPLEPGMSFSITNGEYNSVDGLFYPQTGPQLAYQNITFIGDETVPSGTIICLFLPGGDFLIGGILINGLPSSEDFYVSALNTTSTPSVSLEVDSPGTVTIFNGQMIKSGLGHRLSGSAIAAISQATDSIGFNSPHPDLTGNSNKLIPQGESFATSIICDSVVNACDLETYLNSTDNWLIINGTSSEDINDICEKYCLTSQCDGREIKIEPICQQDSLDLLFVLDNSTSITNQEWSLLKSTVIATINEIDTINPNTRFAIVQFAATNAYNLTHNFTFDASIVTSFSRIFTGNTDVPAAFSNVINDIDNGTIVLRPNTTFKIVLVNDAVKSQSAPYTAYNTIKQAPYNSEITVIRYQNSNSSDAEANIYQSSIASVGGNYYGQLGDNPGDPQGNTLPRRFYPENFASSIPGLAENILNCNLLKVKFIKNCFPSNISWVAENDGQIFSESNNTHSTTIETNGKGSYIISITCSDGCVLRDTFEYPGISGNLENSNLSALIIPDRRRLVKGKLLTPIEHELLIAEEWIEELGDTLNSQNQNNLTIDESSKITPNQVSEINFRIIPIPARDVVWIEFWWPQEQKPIQLQFFNVLGQVVLEHKIEAIPGKNTLKMNVSRLSSGQYFARLFSESVQFNVISLIIQN